MTNGQDRLQFEESHFWDLQDKFIDKNMEIWNEFVDEEFQSYIENGDMSEDDLYEMSRDDEIDKESKEDEDGEKQ